MITILLLVAICVATGLDLQQSPRSLRLLAGDSASFSCSLQGNGELVKGSFYWHFTKETSGDLHARNISAKSGDGRVSVFGTNSPSFRSSLTINNLELADSGTYYCNAITSRSENIQGFGSRLIVEDFHWKNDVFSGIITNLHYLLTVLRYSLLVLLLCYFICVEKFS